MILAALALATTVVDGDTIKADGQRVRLLGFDTPEIDHARCPYERALGLRAKARLVDLMRGGYRLTYSGKFDRYGRPLASMTVREGEVGAVLTREGLARPYRRGRQPWCPNPSTSPVSEPLPRKT